MPPTIRFDGWVLHLDSGELAKDGRRIRLQDQPLQILEALLDQPGELVTREQLIARLWPKGVVDYDTGLNSAVRKLRIALQDDVDTPRYVETVPRKGYRFIGAIDPVPTPAPTATAPILEPRRTYWYAGASIALLLIAGLTVLALRHESTPASQLSSVPAVSSSLDRRTIAVLPFRAATPGEANETVALVIADVVRKRLAARKGVLVIASESLAHLPNAHLDARELDQKVHARFLLQGSAARAGDQIRTDIEVIDAASGAQLLSTALDGPATRAASLCEEIVQRVAHAMRLGTDPAANKGAAPALNLEAYELYIRGLQVLSSERVADAKGSIELLRRATLIDPSFARAYLALGQAQLGFAGDDERLAVAGIKSVDRALELDPALGEAWVERAFSIRYRDPAKAEELFRKGLELAPSYADGYRWFARFLFGQYRRGEAIQMIERARQLDPLMPDLYLEQAFFLMVSRSDVAGHDRLVREALTISPGYRPALVQLALSKYEYSGELAEGIRLVEDALARDPEGEGDTLASTMYLDVGDPAAAKAVLRPLPDPDHVGGLVKIAQYERNPRRAADLVRSLGGTSLGSETGPACPMCEALRDDAMATGDHASALKILEAEYASGSEGGEPRMWTRSLGLVYAHTLVLAGETQRGRNLAIAILAQLDTESVGRAENWLSRERAAAFAVLGDDERALAQLAIAQKMRRYYRWWYLAELDPLYARFRGDPRFQALTEQARTYRAEQRALLEQMRRKGEVPKRSS